MKYCTQNNGDCKTCSLMSYGFDCHNNQIKNLVCDCGHDNRPEEWYVDIFDIPTINIKQCYACRNTTNERN